MQVKIIRHFGFTLILVLAVFTNARGQIVKPGTVTDPPKSKYLGLQIGRADLISNITFIDSLLKFKQVPNAKGLPMVGARSLKGEHVEITGTENNITRAQWTAVLSANAENNKTATNMLAFFTNVIASQEGANWLFQQLFAYTQSPTTAISANTVVNGCNLIFAYDPIKKTLSVTALP